MLATNQIEAQSQPATTPTIRVSRRRNAGANGESVISSWASAAKLAVNSEPFSAGPVPDGSRRRGPRSTTHNPEPR